MNFVLFFDLKLRMTCLVAYKAGIVQSAHHSDDGKSRQQGWMCNWSNLVALCRKRVEKEGKSVGKCGTVCKSGKSVETQRYTIDN